MNAATTAASAATQKMKVATIAAAAIVVAPIFNGAVGVHNSLHLKAWHSQFKRSLRAKDTETEG